MPRPKRNKVVPSAPTVIFSKHSKGKIQALSQKALPQSLQTDTNSDDSEGLVTRAKNGRNRKGIARQEYMMSGALEPSTKGSSEQRGRVSAQEKQALLRIEREEKGLGEADPAEAPRDQEHDSLVPSSFPETNDAVAAQESPRQDAVPRTAEKPGPSSTLNWRTQATPRADSSILSLANFKRRPRQPSILGIGRQEDSITLSSLGGEMSGDLDDDLADFQPDDESTPFHVSRVRPQPEYVRHQPVSTPSGTLASSVSRKRKLTPTEVLIPRSQPSASIHSTEEESEPTFDVLDPPVNDDEEENEPVLPPPKRRAATPPDIWSDTMAPPQSSSPIRSQESRTLEYPPAASNIVKSKTTRRNTKTTDNTATTGKKETRTSRKQKLKPISTETLQSLLPRRRTTRHQGNEFDILSDSDAADNLPQPDEDEDELSFAPTARRIQNKKVPSTSKKSKRATLQPSKNASARPKNTSRQKPAPNSGAAPLSTKSNLKISRTYSRRLSDKENQPAIASSSTLAEDDDNANDSLLPLEDDDEHSSDLSLQLPAAKRKEMASLAKKFGEVDRWEMEFEEVTASSSSPKDAR